MKWIVIKHKKKQYMKQNTRAPSTPLNQRVGGGLFEYNTEK